MSVDYQKEKIMSGMTVRQAKQKLLEIFALSDPNVSFEDRYPGIFVWMETWHRLRARNETLEAVCHAFAAKIKGLHNENRERSQKIHTQRMELAKKAKEIQALQDELKKFKS